MYRFEGDEIALLLNKQEYGMGYQRVHTELYSGRGLDGYVFNAELFVPDEDTRLRKLTESSVVYVKALNFAEPAYESIRKFEIIPRYTQTMAKASLSENRNSLKESTGATEASIELTGTNEVFNRFTAYANDRRITANRGLRPGTYATTEADARTVHTGRQAVARYALPNPEPAIYRFTIKPP